MFQILITGGLLGILGQGARVLIGLKKLREETNSPSNPESFESAFDTTRLMLSIFIGFVAGAMGALSFEIRDMKVFFENDTAYKLIGIGYLGVDFIEGLFLSKVVKTGITTGSATNTKVTNTENNSQATTQNTRIEQKLGELINVMKSTQTGNLTKPVVFPSNTLTNQVSFSQDAFALTDTVGLGGKNNLQDIIALKKRFQSLGFSWQNETAELDKALSDTIKLFQAIINGRQRVFHVDGLIWVPGTGKSAYDWLRSANAPQWGRLPEGSLDNRLIGYFNRDRAQLRDGKQAEARDYGTNWLIKTIVEAGQIYAQNYLTSHANAAVFEVNEMSLYMGGDISGHDGHETGLLADIRLPRTDGISGLNNYENNPLYDQAATRAIIQAFRNTSLGVSKVFFNDQTLIDEGLCRALDGHHDHIHVQVNLPGIIQTMSM